MLHKTMVRTAAAMSLACSAGLALASGSDGGGQAEMGDTAAYNNGPMAGKTLDAAAARALLANKGGVTLTPQESAALDVYLKRRFKL
jgi:hypothetical protein